MQFSIVALFIGAAIATPVALSGELATRGDGPCGSLLYGNPQCCSSDVLGLLDLSCSTRKFPLSIHKVVDVPPPRPVSLSLLSGLVAYTEKQPRPPTTWPTSRSPAATKVSKVAAAPSTLPASVSSARRPKCRCRSCLVGQQKAENQWRVGFPCLRYGKHPPLWMEAV